MLTIMKSTTALLILPRVSSMIMRTAEVSAATAELARARRSK